jgi:acyl-CoA thioester hydrolase
MSTTIPAGEATRVVLPSVEQVSELPCSLQRVVPVDATDGNGHLNMAQYLSLHDEALWPYHAGLGMGKHYRQVQRRGLFTLEQHLAYHAEVLVGDTVTVHCRSLSRTEKLVHGMSFVVNATRMELANTLEYVVAHVDLDRRRTISFGEDVAAALDAEIEGHDQRGWTASISRRLGIGTPPP